MYEIVIDLDNRKRKISSKKKHRRSCRGLSKTECKRNPNCRRTRSRHGKKHRFCRTKKNKKHAPTGTHK